MTNFEKIKSFTIEQMGKFLNMVDLGIIDFTKTLCDVCGNGKDCDTCFRWWLNTDTKHQQGLDKYDWGDSNNV